MNQIINSLIQKLHQISLSKCRRFRRSCFSQTVNNRSQL